jgi:hypothetical protein
MKEAPSRLTEGGLSDPKSAVSSAYTPNQTSDKPTSGRSDLASHLLGGLGDNCSEDQANGP